MQRIPNQITPAQLTTSAATYYTAPANTRATISALTLCNTSGANRTATVHLVPNGGTADSTNKILSAYALTAGQTYVVSAAIGQTLLAGGTLQALSDGNTAVTLVGAVYETSI